MKLSSYILCLLLGFSFSNFASADEASDAAAYAKAQKDIKAAQTDLNRLKAAAAKLEGQIKDNGFVLSDDGHYVAKRGVTCGSTGIFLCTPAELAAKREEVHSIETQLATNADDTRGAQSRFDVASGISGATRTSSASLAQLNDAVKKLTVQTQFSDLKIGNLQTKTVLDKISAAIETTAVGAYFQDKIGQLLNSDVFCSAVKNRCGGKDPYPITPDMMKTLFPATGQGRSGQDSWQKQHPGKTAPADAAPAK